MLMFRTGQSSKKKFLTDPLRKIYYNAPYCLRLYDNISSIGFTFLRGKQVIKK